MSSSPVGKQRRGSAIAMLNMVASNPVGRRRTSSLPLTSDGRPERSARQRDADTFVDPGDGADGDDTGAGSTDVTSQHRAAARSLRRNSSFSFGTSGAATTGQASTPVQSGGSPRRLRRRQSLPEMVSEIHEERREKRREDAVLKHLERQGNKIQGRDRFNYLEGHVRRVQLLEIFRFMRRSHKWMISSILRRWRYAAGLAARDHAHKQEMMAHREAAAARHRELQRQLDEVLVQAAELEQRARAAEQKVQQDKQHIHRLQEQVGEVHQHAQDHKRALEEAKIEVEQRVTTVQLDAARRDGRNAVRNAILRACCRTAARRVTELARHVLRRRLHRWAQSARTVTATIMVEKERSRERRETKVQLRIEKEELRRVEAERVRSCRRLFSVAAQTGRERCAGAIRQWRFMVLVADMASLRERAELGDLERQLQSQERAMRRTLKHWLSTRLRNAFGVWRQWKGRADVAAMKQAHADQMDAYERGVEQQKCRALMYTFVKRWHLLNVNAAFRQWRGAGMRDARMISTVKRWLRSRLLSGFKRWRDNLAKQRSAEYKAQLADLEDTLKDQARDHARGVANRWMSRWINRHLSAGFRKWCNRGHRKVASARVLRRWQQRGMSQALRQWKIYLVITTHENELNAVRREYQDAAAVRLMKKYITRWEMRMLVSAWRQWTDRAGRNPRMLKTMRRIMLYSLSRGWQQWKAADNDYKLHALQRKHERRMSVMQMELNATLMKRVMRRLLHINTFAALRKWCEICAAERELFEKHKALMRRTIEKMMRADKYVMLDRRVYIAWRTWCRVHRANDRRAAQQESQLMRDELNALELLRKRVISRHEAEVAALRAEMKDTVTRCNEIKSRIEADAEKRADDIVRKREAARAEVDRAVTEFVNQSEAHMPSSPVSQHRFSRYGFGRIGGRELVLPAGTSPLKSAVMLQNNVSSSRTESSRSTPTVAELDAALDNIAYRTEGQWYGQSGPRHQLGIRADSHAEDLERQSTRMGALRGTLSPNKMHVHAQDHMTTVADDAEMLYMSQDAEVEAETKRERDSVVSSLKFLSSSAFS